MFRRVVGNGARVLAALGAAVSLAGAAWAGQQDFTLVNRTGYTLVSVSISPSAVQDWEEDVLGVDLLKDGESVFIEFSPKQKAEERDLQVVDEDGDEAVWYGLRLDRISRVTLRFDKSGEPVADLE